MANGGLDFSAEVDKKTLRAFLKAGERFHTELGNSCAVAARRSAIALVKSLRKRTRKSPKIVSAKDVELPKDGLTHITADSGKDLRRVIVYRWIGGQRKPFEYWIPTRFKYKTRMGMRNGNYQGIVTKDDDKAYVKKIARNAKGRIMMWGLAKQSWGWFMRTLFRQSANNENPKVKITKSMVDGFIRDEGKGKKRQIDVEIHNRVSYINEALEPGALNESVAAATKYINGTIDKGIAKAGALLKS